MQRNQVEEHYKRSGPSAEEPVADSVGEVYYTALPKEPRSAVSENKQWISVKNVGGIAQCILGMGGLGVFVLYIEASKNCAKDPSCPDPLLTQLPEVTRTATLIFCGGITFALTSAVCAMNAIPNFLKLMGKYSGYSKFFAGLGTLLAASATTLEPVIVAIKEYPSLAEAFAQPIPYITMVAAYPMNLDGMSKIAAHDLSYLALKIEQLRGRYQDQPKEQHPFYQRLCEEHHAFQTRSANRWKALVPKARTVAIPDQKQDPLLFLYSLSLPEVSDAKPSFLGKLAYGVCGLMGITFSLGSLIPHLLNTYHFLQEELADEDSSSEMIMGLSILTMMICLGRIRAIPGKIIHAALRLADWSLNQDLEYQLYPKLTTASWLLGMSISYFSYAVIKTMALKNFSGECQRPLAEIAAISSECSHLAFFLHFFSLILMRLEMHYLYGVKQKVEAISNMGLVDFEHFVRNLNDEERDLLGINLSNQELKNNIHESVNEKQEEQEEVPYHIKFVDSSFIVPFNESDTEKKSDEVDFVEIKLSCDTSLVQKQELPCVIKAHPQKQLPSLKVVDAPPKEERFATMLCRWFFKKNTAPEAQNHLPTQNRVSRGFR
jgi:hypothetical protein